MKLLVIGNQERAEKYRPKNRFTDSIEMVVCPRDASEEALLSAGSDADFLLVDAIVPVRRSLMEQMPNLKLIHSEGVAYHGIDQEAARERGIYVCNCQGVNAGAVAEQTILLMLGLLRNVVPGDRAVRDGRQIEVKERSMVEGIRELPDCAVGLIGFGAIGKATARLLKAFGCPVYYYSSHRSDSREEQEYGVAWMEEEELLSSCDIVSLHVPVTPDTMGMVGTDFLKKMKSSAYLINTSRGELMDHEALREALMNGTIAGAGLDTLYPEPVSVDNSIASLPENCPGRVLLSPHIGGITTGTFIRAHRMVWENLERIAAGKRPERIVNGL